MRRLFRNRGQLNSFIIDRAITDREAAVIAEALKLNSSLLELDLSRTSLVAGLFIDIEFHLPGNSISDDGARALAKALKENSSLKHLNVGCAFMFARFLSLPYDANLAFASCRQRTSGKGSSSNRKGSESKLISHAAQY